MIEANREVEWTPDFYGKRMEDWLRNMGDWCISRKRYWGLPLPFYRAPSGKVTVVGSVAELRERAVDPALVDGLQELHRPWIDAVQIRTDDGEIAERVAEVGDCWLDAGIVPFSTLGWDARHVRRGRLREGRRRGPDRRPTCPTTPTGRSGSRPTGCRRCASRSGSGSTRSCS